MLFFLFLSAAPAMKNPSKDADDSPRKIWLKFNTQILNALFCVIGFGLAPWRLRDSWWLQRMRISKDREAMKRLSEQNASWFRPPGWFTEGEEKQVTFTGVVGPPTKLWKLSFVVWMMVFNTAFQAVLASMMWAYNRSDPPSWSSGTFIALGWRISLLAGVMMWWEKRKIKKIGGPIIKIVDAVHGKAGEVV